MATAVEVIKDLDNKYQLYRMSEGAPAPLAAKLLADLDQAFVNAHQYLESRTAKKTPTEKQVTNV